MQFGDLVLPHQEVDPIDHSITDLAAARESLTVVDRELAADAELVGLLGDDVNEFRIAQQGLGRYAADIQADPAPVFLFDDCGLETELGCPDRRDITAGPGP